MMLDTKRVRFALYQSLLEDYKCRISIMTASLGIVCNAYGNDNVHLILAG